MLGRDLRGVKVRRRRGREVKNLTVTGLKTACEVAEDVTRGGPACEGDPKVV